jgi:serine/threonine protein kinase/WD40 repeat protein
MKMVRCEESLSMAPQSIAHYRMIAKIGEGGMGEVWRAVDTKLGREVAIKILPEAFTQDEDRLARFTREAQVLASLNHPNIASIHGVEERALIMELVEGPTLAERIAQGPMLLEEALAAAAQIAEGLEYAHERGVVHRDLKPANLKITPEGRLKILDFGLAKAAPGDATPIDPESSPTLTMRATQAGIIIGTAAYMSPEQAMGKPVDKRADIWSFGAVLWELLTGRQLFKGETVTDTLAGVLREPIDFARLPAETPAPIRGLLRRCLDRNPKTRLRDIGEARIALKEPAAHLPATVTAPPAPRSFWPWIAAACAATTLAMGALYLHRPAEEPRVLKLQISPPAKSALVSTAPAISPDGRRIAFVAVTDGVHHVWTRDLDSLESRLLPGTEGAIEPFWSPDSRSIGFFAEGYLKKIDAAGGPASSLCDAPAGRGGTWSQNGVIVFSPSFSGGLLRVSSAGGASVRLTTVDQAAGEAAHIYPSFLPDGRHVLYFAMNRDHAKHALWVADLNSKERRRILPTSTNTAYAPPGFLLLVRDGTLMALPFNAATAQVTGEAVPVAEQVDYYLGMNQSRALFSVSGNGVLVYGTGMSRGRIQLTWFDRSSKLLGTVGPPGLVNWPAISPDGKTVAVSRDDPQTGVSDVWLYDLARGSSNRLTSHSKGNSLFPLWSPDGEYVSYSSDWDSETKLYRKASGGGGAEEILYAPRPSMRADDWSRDGRYLVGEQGNSVARGNLWVFPLFGDGKQYQFLNSEFHETRARISPDSRWLAYVSDRTGRNEVYVTSFPAAGAQTQISTGGGSFPAWSGDGKQLFYLAGTRQLMAVAIKAGSRIEAGIPEFLFEVPFATTSGNSSRFDVAKDGRFLIPVDATSSALPSIVVVGNWTAGLRR